MAVTKMYLLLARRAGLALFALLLGVYVLTMSGHTYSSDEETMLAGGEFLISSGSFHIPKGDLRNLAPGVDGQTYSRYGPGQSLAVVPFVVAGQLVARAAPPLYERMIVRLFALLAPALVTAATGLIVYAWALELGVGVRAALFTGLLFGLTSLAWPYGRTLFAEPLAALFLALCGYGLRRSERRWWAIAGAAVAAALAAKFQSLLALPLLGGYALLCGWQHGAAQPASSRFGRWSPLFGRVVWGLVGLALPMGLLMLYNQVHFGGPLKSGYGTNDVSNFFGDSWADGLYGLTVSTGKGLLFFSPTVLLGLLGAWLARRTLWREALLALAMLASHLYVYSQVSYWHGDGSWGPRYMVFTLPFLYLPAAGLFAALAHRRRQRFAKAAVGALVAVSVFVQLMPILLNFDTYILLSSGRARFFTPSQSPILAHARIWAERVQEQWLRANPPRGTALFVDGFSFSEGDRSKGEVLPRWTNATAVIRVSPPGSGPIDGTLVLADHRPWPLPRAQFQVLLDGAPLPGVERVNPSGNGVDWQLHFSIPADRASRPFTLAIQSDTWNPTVATADNPRNEDLGLRVETIDLQQNGQQLALRESLPIPVPQNSRRALWVWYQDTPNHHLFDTWWWYVYAAHLPVAPFALLLLLVGLPAALLALGGGLGVRSALRQAATTHPNTSAPAQREPHPVTTTARMDRVP